MLVITDAPSQGALEDSCESSTLIPKRRRRGRMGDMERLHKIKYMIQSRGSVPMQDFLQELEISKATFKRDLEYLRSRMNAEIVYDRDSGGYRFDQQQIGKKVELPGLWFSEKEATALVLMQHLLSNLDRGGLIGPHIDPLMNIVDGILGQSETGAKALRKRLKVFGMSARKSSLDNFEDIGHALLERRRIRITHYSKSKDETTEREVSPQSMIYYRDNWYLDAWCHLRNDLRSFAVDGIRKVDLTDKKAQEVPEAQLKEHFSESYGIFSGKATKRAKLRFTAQRARWVAGETWHGKQVGTFLSDGSYVLEFDYDKDPELIMDILKHGSEVEVLEPAELRKHVQQALQATISKYQNL
jgi:predicted DNA-binding transcriptional regulator YafY